MIARVINTGEIPWTKDGREYLYEELIPLTKNSASANAVYFLASEVVPANEMSGIKAVSVKPKMQIKRGENLL